MSYQITNNEIMSRIISQNDAVISQNQILLSMLQKNPEDDFETDSLTEEESILSELDTDELDTDIDTVSSTISTLSNADSGSSYTDADSGSSYADSGSVSSTISSGSFIKRKLKKSRRKLPLEFIIVDEDKVSYTPEEVQEMNDCELSINFSRIVGQNQLYCNHCHRQKALEYWIHSIRKRCLKKDGLCATMTVPKTCDHQQAVNSICNPVNNRVYPTIRNPNTSERTKQAFMEAKAICFEKMGKEINPYKY